MKNFKNLFKKNILLTIVVCLLMIFSFAMFNIGFNSVKTLREDQTQIPSQQKNNQKYLDTKSFESSLQQTFYPSFLLDDERITYLSDSKEKEIELPTISIGFDQNWDDGFFNLVTKDDIILDQDDPNNKVKYVNLELNKNSSHYKNSYLQILIRNSDPVKAKKIQDFYDKLLYCVFQSPDSIFQKNLVFSINDSYFLSSKEKFPDIKEVALNVINPNNKKNGNRKWISNNIQNANNIITVTRGVDADNSNQVSWYNYKDFWDNEKNVAGSSLVYGYNGQIGSLEYYNDSITSSDPHKTKTVQHTIFFTSVAQHWTYLENCIQDSNNFNGLCFKMNDSNDYRYNDSKNDFYYKNTPYDSIYYKISSNVSFDSEFTNYYLDYIAEKNNITVEKRTELLTYDLYRNYNFKLVNGNDVNYNNEFKIIKKSDSLNINSWDYNQILVSPGFFNKNNLKIGDTLNIDNIEVIIVGVATDSYNIYPTVYNNEYISDSSKDAIVYCSQALIKKIMSEDTDSNNSMNDYLFFGPKGYNENINENIIKFIEQLNDCFNYSLNENIISNKIGDFDSLNSFYYGYKMVDYVSKVLKIVMFFFSTLFFALSISIFLIIIKEIINSQRKVIGIMKANGYRFLEITKSYYLFLFVTIAPSLLIGFGTGYGLLNLLMINLSNFFSLVVSPKVSFLFFGLSFITYLLVTLLAFSILLVKKINVSPLLLIHNNIQTKNKKIKIKSSFSMKGNLTHSFYRTSRMQVLLLGLISFVSTSITILSTIIVIYFYNYNSNKYSIYKFNTETTYNNLVVGNPLNQINEIEWNNKDNNPNQENLIANGLVPPKFKNKNNQILSISELKKYINKNISNYLWELIVQGIIFNYHKNISINYLSWIVNEIVGGKDSTPGSDEYINYRNICEDVSNLLANYLPKSLGMSSISYEEFPTAASRGKQNLNDAYIDVWESILNKIANEKMSSDSKIVWKENNRNVANFNLGFNVIPLEKNANTLTTTDLNISSIGESRYRIYGQKQASKNSFNIKNLNVLNNLNNSSLKDNVLNVYASKVFATKNNKKNYDAKVNYNQLQFLSDEKNDKWINFSDYNNQGDARWYYEDENGELKNFYNNNRTFSQNSFNVNDITFVDNNNQIILNTNDIVLAIKKEDISSWSNYDISDFQTLETGMKNLLDTEKAPTIKTTSGHDVKLITEKNGFYYIRPYSLSFSSNSTAVDADIKSTWYDAVINTSAKKQISLVRTTNVSKEITLNIVEIIDDYDTENFYTDQESLNQLLGVDSSDKWFNSSTSELSLPPNLIWSYGLTNNNGNGSIKYFDSIKKINSNINYIGMQKEIIQKIINIVLGFGIVIYTMLIILVVTSTVFISRNFIYDFRKSILVLKAMGYSKLRINCIILTLLLSPMVIGSILANAFFLSTINLSAKAIIIHYNILIPIGSGISLMPITLFATIFISLLTFFGISKIIEKNKLSEIN